MGSKIELRPGRWINISVYQSKPTHPTIFMIHGLGGRGYQWREQIKHLQHRYNLIVPDLLGHGDSEKPRPDRTNPYSFEELNKDLQVLFERYSGDKNYIFGHSYGAAFSTFLGKAYQDKIQKLVLITPVSCEPFTKIPLAYFLPLPLLELLRSHLDKLFEKMAFAPSDNPLLLKEEKEGRDLNQMYVIKALLQGMKDIPSLQVNQLSLPSLIICGKLDKVIPSTVARKFYTAIPQHQFYVLEKAAHMVHLERSLEVNHLLDEFL